MQFHRVPTNLQKHQGGKARPGGGGWAGPQKYITQHAIDFESSSTQTKQQFPHCWRKRNHPLITKWQSCRLHRIHFKTLADTNSLDAVSNTDSAKYHWILSGGLLSLAGVATSIIFVATNIILSRQKFCQMFVATKHVFCHEQIMIVYFCREKLFVATNIILSRQMFCHD